MENPSDYQMRYGGIGRLLTPNGLTKLKNSHVLVIGIGGVGSWCVEALARSGIGKITIVDLDDICVTNTNRQLHALGSTIGKSKVDVMKSRLQDATPDCQVTAIHEFFDTSTMELILDQNYDVIIDCIDSLSNKCLLINACKERNFKLITIGGAGGKVDPMLIRTSDLGLSTNDTLLKRVRRTLKSKWGWDNSEGQRWGIEAIYSIERSMFLDTNDKLHFVPDLKKNTRIDCNSGIGTASWITGTFGLVAAAKTIDILVPRAH